MMNNTQLVDTLKARVEVVEGIGGSIGANPKLIEDEIATYIKNMGLGPGTGSRGGTRLRLTALRHPLESRSSGSRRRGSRCTATPRPWGTTSQWL